MSENQLYAGLLFKGHHLNIRGQEVGVFSDASEASFYVDDAVCSFQDVETVIEVQVQLTRLMEMTRVKIRKWMSNRLQPTEGLLAYCRQGSANIHHYRGQFCTGVRSMKKLGVVRNSNEDDLDLDASIKSCFKEDSRRTKSLVFRRFRARLETLPLYTW